MSYDARPTSSGYRDKLYTDLIDNDQAKHRGGPTLMHKSLQVRSVFGWTLSRDHNDINALNL